MLNLLPRDDLDARWTSRGGKNALMLAAMRGHADMVGALVPWFSGAGGAISGGGNGSGSGGVGGGSVAGRAGDESTSRSRSDSRTVGLASRLDDCDGDGVTALCHAAGAGSVDVARILVEAGASVNHRETPNAQTPLIAAASAGHAAVITFLYEQFGAAVNAIAGVRECTLL